MSAITAMHFDRQLSPDSSYGTANNYSMSPMQAPALLPATVPVWGSNMLTYQTNNQTLYTQGPSDHTLVTPLPGQQVQYLQDVISKLQAENITVKAEHTMIQNAYNTLVAQLTLNASPTGSFPDANGLINISLQALPSTLLLNTTSTMPQLDRTNYPKVCFWTEAEWKQWCSTTPQGQKASAYTSFLEDEAGNALTAKRISDILQTARKLWHEFRIKGLIDGKSTWTSMMLTTKKAFWIEISRSYLELNLCEGSWKSDMLGKKHYSGYKQIWFTNKSEGKLSASGKRKMKQDASDDSEDRSTFGPKRARTSLSPFLGGSDDVDPSSSPDTPVNASGDTPSIPDTPSVTGVTPLLDDDACTLATGNDKFTSLDLSLEPTIAEGSGSSDVEACPRPLPYIQNPLTSVHFKIQPSIKTTELSKTLDEDLDEDLYESTDQPSSDPVANPNQADEVTNNPSSNLDTTSNTELSSEEAQVVTTMAATPKTVSLPTPEVEKKKTWRPPSKKSACTLCMHQYQRQIGGSLQEFNSYFEALSAEAKAKYREDVKRLVADSIWINGTVEVIAKFSNNPMY